MGQIFSLEYSFQKPLVCGLLFLLVYNIHVNILILYKPTCFDFQEVIVRPFSEHKNVKLQFITGILRALQHCNFTFLCSDKILTITSWKSKHVALYRINIFTCM
jgi:hypothetical protein